MEHNQQSGNRLKGRLAIAASTALFAGIGAILGAVAYYQQWLG